MGWMVIEPHPAPPRPASAAQLRQTDDNLPYICLGWVLLSQGKLLRCDADAMMMRRGRLHENPP